MQVSEIMSKDIGCVDAASPLTVAAEMMRQLNVGALPVKKQDDVVGLLTDRDIVVRGVAVGADPMSTPVQDVMSPEPVFCEASESVEEAANIMKRKQVRRLLVTGEDRKLIGIVSLGDLASRQPDERIPVDVTRDMREH
jgi:CBS domain-containing protein